MQATAVAPAPSRRPDWRAIGLFLAITFGVTYVVEFGLLAAGVRFDNRMSIDAKMLAGQLVVSALMWVPGLTALALRKWWLREGFAEAGFRISPLKPYLWVWLAAPAAFALMYGVTWLAGLGHPDPALGGFIDQMNAASTNGRTISTGVAVAIITSMSVLMAPVSNVIFAIGEEMGWTAFLLPKLLPAGKWKAALLYGPIWGLWHAPLILGGFNYSGYPVAGVFLMCALTTAFGFTMTALWLRYRSVWLTAFLHSAWNSQAYGIWRLLFHDADPLWGGMGGLVGILVLALPGLWLLARSPESPEQPESLA